MDYVPYLKHKKLILVIIILILTSCEWTNIVNLFLIQTSQFLFELYLLQWNLSLQNSK